MSGFWYIVIMILAISLFRSIFPIRRSKVENEEYRSENDACHHQPISEDKKAENTQDMKPIDNNQMNQEVINTKTLMLKALHELGCQPEEFEDDTVGVVFQGENFRIDFWEMYAVIWDLGWSHVNINDLNLPKVREAINRANFQIGPTIVMGDAEDDGNRIIHSRYNIPLHPGIPNLTDYIAQSFNMFFNAKQRVFREFNQLKIEEESKQNFPNPKDIDPCKN